MSKILPTDGFLRSDDNPAAIINVDNDALKAYKIKRERDASKDKKINTLEEELAKLREIVNQLLEKTK